MLEMCSLSSEIRTGAVANWAGMAYNSVYTLIQEVKVFMVMVGILIRLLVYILINVLILAVGSCVGFLLRWLIPAIETGTAVLIGVVVTAISLQIYGRFSAFVESYGVEPDPEDAPEFVIVRDLNPISSFRSGRKRKHKAT